MCRQTSERMSSCPKTHRSGKAKPKKGPSTNDSSVVKADDLSPNIIGIKGLNLLFSVSEEGLVGANDTPVAAVHNANARQNLEEVDVFRVIARVDEWRRAHDLVYQLLTDPDETELHRHVLGVVAQPDTTENGQPGLLYQLYGAELSPRAQAVMAGVQYSDTDNSPFKHNTVARRVQLNFLLFVALATENDFAQYVVLKTWNRESLRVFINCTVKPLLSDLMHGSIIGDTTPGSHQIEKFVTRCRDAYMRECMPTPVGASPANPLPGGGDN